ncbi:DUF4157 domain-containing protein [Moorena producens JHB]|uniref:DUF4157 domain-containing protein n=1 Tax=Moorena producens (strain JHB) TaxID=1454205 RepID=A0A1D9FX66_MOOP1|nr:DUF4157 domain-containing protein [Moorena producens]AOY79962.2 DUF4157 domain-containing protein [Moorena producens JHB]
MGYQRTSQTKNNQTTPKGKTVQAKPTPLATHSPVHPLLQLQRKLGNQAVNRLIQTKMQVGEANDVYEKEADTVAAQVMRMAAPPVQNSMEDEEIQTKPIALQLQSDEEEIQTKPIALQLQSDEEEIQTKPIALQLQSDEEEIQTKPIALQLQSEEEEIQTKPIALQLQSEEEEIQTKPIALQLQSDEEEIQTKPIALQLQSQEEEIQTKPIALQLQSQEEEIQTKPIALQLQSQEEEIQTKPIALQLQSQEEEIQTKANPGQTPQVSSNLETKIQSRRGTGQPLPDSTRAFMEPRFGANFSGVRVHTDSSAVQMNKELGAQAFTHGRDIFYGAGKSPGKNSLTAHELTHTIQQTGGIQAKVIDQQAKKTNKFENKTGFAIPIKDSPGNGVNQESQTLVKDTEIKPEVEAENTVNTEVVAPQETAETKAVSAPKPETKATSVSSGKTPGKNQEAMASEAANQGIKAEVNQETTATPAEATPQETTAASPESDPDFKAVVAKAKGVANKQKQHAPASTKAKEAQAAAVSPAKEIASKAQANQVGEMAQAPTPGFDAAAFKAKLMERIKSAAPKTLEQADEFKDSNKLASVKSQMQNTVKQEQTASQAPLEQKAKQAPDTSSIEPKSVTPLAANEAGAVTKNIGADKAIPKAKGQGEVEAPLQESSQKLDQQMAEADVTSEQLAKSNEPQFQTALAAKQEAQSNASQAPQAYRQFEQDQLTQAQGEAATTAGQQLQGMHGSRAQLLAQVTNQQVEAKGKDEQERAKVAGDIQQIYNQTKTKVEDILNGLDGKVNQEFDAGANQATKAFENYVDEKMRAYKDERYSGLTGAGLWLRDKFLGLPSEVNAFYQEGRQLYLAKMDVVLDKIVNIIGTALTDAKAEIAKGRQEIKNYVAQLPENLKTVGQQAATDIQSQFDQLEQSVDSKQNQLINTLAENYNEKLQAVDARIDEMKAANQGLVDQAANAITGVIDTIKKLKDMLLSVLSKASDVIGNIIKDPIGFLGNLISGIKQGFENFVANIGQHLQAGLIGWLTGTLGPMGIQLPDDIFSLPGIFSLVTQVLNLTFTYIRGKAVKLFGEPVVAGMEKSVEIFQVLRDRGPMGLWEHVKEQFNDLKQTVIEEIKSMVVTQVITAGVKWVLSLLNPASAFVKAAMAIYDIIMFFVNRGSQVLELVNAVVDAVSAIASGAVGGAAKLVENALAKAVPVVIGFLASLLGIGGLAKKVENIIGKIRERIDQAIDKVLLKAKGLFKGKKGKGNKDGKFTKKDRKAGLAAFEKEEEKYLKQNTISKENAQKVAKAVKRKHGVFKSITVIDGKDSWDYQYVFRMTKDTKSTKVKLKKPEALVEAKKDSKLKQPTFLKTIFYDVVTGVSGVSRDTVKKNWAKSYIKDGILFETEISNPRDPKAKFTFHEHLAGITREATRRATATPFERSKKYIPVAKAFGIAKPSLTVASTEADLKNYYQWLRKEIIKKYKDEPFSKFKSDVFNHPTVKIKDLNRWSEQLASEYLQALDFAPPGTYTFNKTGSMKKKRTSDSYNEASATLIERKTHRRATRPSPEEIDQMKDYNIILTTSVVGKRKTVDGKGVIEKIFTRIQYQFFNEGMKPLWESTLRAKIPGKFSIEIQS